MFVSNLIVKNSAYLLFLEVSTVLDAKWSLFFEALENLFTYLHTCLASVLLDCTITEGKLKLSKKMKKVWNVILKVRIVKVLCFRQLH